MDEMRARLREEHVFLYLYFHVYCLLFTNPEQHFAQKLVQGDSVARGPKLLSIKKLCY